METERKKTWGTEMELTLFKKSTPRVIEDEYQALLRNIRQRNTRVAILGAGYVGLSLAVETAKANFKVSCYEIDVEKTKRLNDNMTDVPGITSEDLKTLQEKKLLTFSSDIECLQDAEVIVICVATPLNAAREPDTSQITMAAECIQHYLKPGTLVILESTSYPGTTEELVKPILEVSGLKSEQDFWLAFSPERVDPANTKYNLKNTPKIVSGLSPESTDLTEAFYTQFVDKVIKVSSPAAAEMTKLYENIFRNINIAFANEMAMLCERMGLNIWEIIGAASTKPYGFTPFYPGPGPGGHCIPVDPHYLAWKARQHNFHCKFIELASAINNEMPRHVCNRVNDALNQSGKPVKGSKILLVGAAYKPEIGDTREAPILEIFPLLAKRQAEVAYYDPYVPTLQMSNPGVYSTVSYNPEEWKEYDCIVILTDHDCLPYQEIADNTNLIVDCKNALSKRGIFGKANVVSL